MKKKITAVAPRTSKKGTVENAGKMEKADFFANMSSLVFPDMKMGLGKEKGKK